MLNRKDIFIIKMKNIKDYSIEELKEELKRIK